MISKVAAESTVQTESLPWYAVRIRSNFEQRTRLALENQGFDAFVPTYASRRQRTDRTKVIAAPLFPGYVFSRFAGSQKLAIGKTLGVIDIVGNRAGPLAIDPKEMTHLRTLWAKVAAMPHPFLRAGQWVKVERGPLTGVEGILVRRKGSFRIVVAITLLERAVAAELDVEWVNPCKASATGGGAAFVLESATLI